LFICQATKLLLNLIPKLFLLLLKRKKEQLSVKGRQRSAIYNIPYLMQLLGFWYGYSGSPNHVCPRLSEKDLLLWPNLTYLLITRL